MHQKARLYAGNQEIHKEWILLRILRRGIWRGSRCLPTLSKKTLQFSRQFISIRQVELIATHKQVVFNSLSCIFHQKLILMSPKNNANRRIVATLQINQDFSSAVSVPVHSSFPVRTVWRKSRFQVQNRTSGFQNNDSKSICETASHILETVHKIQRCPRLAEPCCQLT